MMNPETEKSIQIKKLLREELQLAGLRFDLNSWIQSESVLDEISHAIRPDIHEGTVFSYGSVFVESIDDFDRYEIIKMDLNLLRTARKMADGKEWNVLYHQNQFFGLIRFPASISSEMRMIKRFPARGGLMISRSQSGACRFYQGDKLILHDRRNWVMKPDVKITVASAASCIDNLNKKLFQSLLEFAFYLVSPTEGAGAILIWHLTPVKSSGNLESLNLSFANDSHLQLIFHQLIQSDGATLVSHDGKLMSSGIQIRYSSKSRRLIPDYKGTRHTSSIRFSYDSSQTIVITISEDGPVSVFLNGVNITGLHLESGHQITRKVKLSNPEEKEKISTLTQNFHCQICGKNCRVEGAEFLGKNHDFPINCPTCHNLVGKVSANQIQIKTILEK